MIRPRIISLLPACLVALSGAPAATAQSDRPVVVSPSRPLAMGLADGLDATEFARRLGRIADVAIDAEGRLYSADPVSGRIWIISDRARDGRADSVQPLPHRFDAPGALTMSAQGLLVSDRSGLWRVQGTGTPQLLAPFARSGALPVPHPVTVMDGGAIRLGLNLPDDKARLLSIDPQTGEATAWGDTDGRIVGFAKGPETAPRLLIVARGDDTLFGPTLGSLQTLPPSTGALWVEPERGHVLLSGNTGLSDHTASLMRISEDGRRVLSGMRTGPVLRDERGIFVADPQRGRILLIRPEPVRPPAEPVQSFLPAEPRPQLDPDALILRGSGIDAMKAEEAERARRRNDQSDDTE